MSTESLTVDEYVLRIVLARWQRAQYINDWLSEWEDEAFAKMGFMLG